VASSHSRPNWEILSAFWHPVARSSDLADNTVLRAVLLDVPLVLYRIHGTLTAAVDRCPHRGTRLSLGRVENGRLICPYHGIGFDAGGICRTVPFNERFENEINYLNVPTFQLEERYGLVWVCLQESPAMPLPDWSAIFEANNQFALMHMVWDASAGRHVENFCDLAHFPFAHAGTFGVPGNVRVPSFPIERTSSGFSFTADIPMRLGESAQSVEIVRTDYDIVLPFASCMTMRYSRGNTYICDVASPISLTRTAIFMIVSRDHDQHEAIEPLLQTQHAVNEEDRLMVESQEPKALPLSGNIDKHMSTDRFSVEYRKWWASLGLSDFV
jgi:phenylpropionate dioxygenase-like ring-hydroxylating dioxygenase large terminal subunit